MSVAERTDARTRGQNDLATDGHRFSQMQKIVPLHPCFIRVNLWPEIRFFD
jgi:hypothetical protein